MNRPKVVVLGEISLVVLHNVLRILAKLLLPKGEELAGIAVLFKEEAMPLAIRVSREVSSLSAELSKLTLVNFKPTVTRIIVLGKGSVHK